MKALSICGVRNFGPDDADCQQINFVNPLTLILGKNGCGKTTIIECLRFAVTGQFPPGGRNECFVYDAKVNKSREVMAQVKLKVVNTTGNDVIVSRSMQVQSKEKKSTFKTLDASISRKDSRGQHKEISSRCAEIDQVMYEELGVSKAIINYVIFCHQDDSGWPLDEGKKVKERFDEIFDADKYSNCFDKMQKIRKQYAANIKLSEQTVNHLAERKQEVDKKKMDVVTTQEKISTAELKIQELDEKIKPVIEKLKKIAVIEKDLIKYETEREKAKARLENSLTQQEDLKKAIKKLFVGDTDDLKGNIRSYESDVKLKEAEMRKLQKQVADLTKKEQKLSNEISTNNVTCNKLILLESQQQERVDRRNSLILEAATIIDVAVPEEIENDQEALKIISSLSNKLKGLQQELKDFQATADAEEKRHQRLVDESRDALSRHNQMIVSKETEVRDLSRQAAKLEDEITDANESKQRLDSLQKDLENTERELEKVSGELDSKTCQADINNDEKSLDVQEAELETLNLKISKLQKQSAKIAEMDVVKEALAVKEKNLGRLKNKHRESIVQLIKRMPDAGFKHAILECECNVSKEVDELKAKLKSKQHEVTSLEAKRQHLRELLKSKKTELSSTEDQMYDDCGTQSLDATLAKVDEAVTKYQKEQNELSSSVFIISKYKEKLENNNNCPLCHRGFDSQSEVTELISELTNKVLGLPSKLERVQSELSKESARRDKLLSLKPLAHKIDILKEKEIPELEKKLKDIDKELRETNDTIEELSMSLAEPEQKLKLVSQLSSEMPLLDQLVQDIKSSTTELKRLEGQCGDIDSDMTLDEATDKQMTIRQKVNLIRARIKTSQTKLNSHTRKVQSVIDKKNKLKEEHLSIQTKVQEIYSLQDRLNQIVSNKEKSLIEISKLKGSTEALEIELKSRDISKQNIVTKKRQQIDDKRQEVSKLDSSINKIKAIDGEIQEHARKNVKEKIKTLKESDLALQEEKKNSISEREAAVKSIDVMKDELSKQEIYKRDLEDNLKLRNFNDEAVKCQAKIEEINEKIGEVSSETLKEKKDLISRHTNILNDRAQTEGRKNELEEKLKESKLDLMKSHNKDVGEKYRASYYELEITKALMKDIKDYLVAMDKCLMQYHKEKMENINLIIKEMWRKIYRGNDIDYIEIKTEGNTVSDNDGRRKYEYRVIQSKNGVEIDMRGRCSAGQKVLACLIIRLALAETFSTRFGVLALDEPTTSLDGENVKSLCSSLAEIVRERMQQKNFMFIIITHDKEFIDLLADVDKVSHYFEIYRNDEGKSRIKKVKF